MTSIITDTVTDTISVLVVDDSPAIRANLVALLEQVPDITVAGQAEDGIEGVETALRDRPDVVVMDMQMPRMDGIEAAREILSSWPGARIIMNSAYTDEALVAEALAYGVTAYLSKDLRPSKLVRAIIDAGRTSTVL